MTSQHYTGTHPFYIGMYIHIYTHIYVHIYTSQKECLHIFSHTCCSSSLGPGSKSKLVFFCHFSKKRQMFGQTAKNFGSLSAAGVGRRSPNFAKEASWIQILDLLEVHTLKANQKETPPVHICSEENLLRSAFSAKKTCARQSTHNKLRPKNDKKKPKCQKKKLPSGNRKAEEMLNTPLKLGSEFNPEKWCKMILALGIVFLQ